MQEKGNLLCRNVNARSCSVTSPVIETALLLNTSQSQLYEALGGRTHWEHEYHHHMSEETLGWDLTEMKPKDIFQHPKSSKRTNKLQLFLIFNLGPIQANISGLKLSPADSWLRSARVYPSYGWQGPVLGAPTIGTEPGRMRKVLFFPSNGSVEQASLVPSRQQWSRAVEGKQLNGTLPIHAPMQGTREWCWVSLFSSVFHWLCVWVGVSLRRWLAVETRMYKSYQHRILDVQIAQTSTSSHVLFVCLFSDKHQDRKKRMENNAISYWSVLTSTWRR